MPIYEYECKECGHQFEAIRKVSDGPPDACPACGVDALAKRMSKVAFRLKGTGWYETDFKTKPAEKKSDGEKADGEGSTAAKDDKPAADKPATDKADKADKADKPAAPAAEKKAAAKSGD